MRTLTLLLLAASAYAQVTYEIKGTVVEPGGARVGGAMVAVGGGSVPKVEVVSDGDGRFSAIVAGPGPYTVIARKDGYFPNTAQGGTVIVAVIGSERPRADVTVTLARAIEISGRVIDDETRVPVPGARVYLILRRWSQGRVVLTTLADTGTDSEGIFTFSEIRAGDEYLVSPQAVSSATTRVVPNFTADDAEKTDEEYAATYWPGGSTDPETALAAPVTAAGFTNIGNMLVRKIRLYRARITIGACDGSVRVALLNPPFKGPFPCGSEFLLRSLPPSGYSLYATPAPSQDRGIPGAVVWGRGIFAVVDRNSRGQLPLQPGTIAEGELIIPEGMRKPAVVPTITVLSFESRLGTNVPDETFLQWNEDQRHFRLAISPFGSQLQVEGLGGQTYAKEIRLNGLPLQGGSIPSGAPAQRLEIHLDDKFATLNVTVIDGGRTVPLATILPVADASLPVQALGNTSRLAPGTYRIIALPRGSMAAINPPGVFIGALSTAPSVTLAPGETKSIEVRLSDVR